MGYTTRFDGVLKFTKEPSVTQLATLQSFMGEDVREHPEWTKELGKEYSYIQFELTKDFKGIRWDGSEKFYNAVEVVNLILINMRAEWPDFGLEGQLEAQGEDLRDRWLLAIDGGRAVKKKIAIEGSIYECPHCGNEILTSKANKLQ